jgi:hypothetical protein
MINVGDHVDYPPFEDVYHEEYDFCGGSTPGDTFY